MSLFDVTVGFNAYEAYRSNEYQNPFNHNGENGQDHRPLFAVETQQFGHDFIVSLP
jgi:hypothetical protein